MPYFHCSPTGTRRLFSTMHQPTMKSAARPKRIPETVKEGRLSRLKLAATGVAPHKAAVNNTRNRPLLVKGWEANSGGLQSAEPFVIVFGRCQVMENGIVMDQPDGGQTSQTSQTSDQETAR